MTTIPGNFSVYDQSFYLLFLAWYYRMTGEAAVLQLMRDRYAEIELHLDNAGPGGFAPQPPGTRSHNPYMHLFEALLAAFRATSDDFWLAQARRTLRLFLKRLLDRQKTIVFEFLNQDWSVAADGRVEPGHQFEWATLLLEHYEITPWLLRVATQPYLFACRYGFEDGLVIDAVNAEGSPIDRRKLLWSQLEAARHFAVQGRVLNDPVCMVRAAEMWQLIRERFFHPNGWTWHNRLTADGVPVEEPSLARLLYHVVAGGSTGEQISTRNPL